MQNVMEVSGLRVAYSGREAVHGVNLAVARGMVTALVGPSGCGKTTVLRTLNRLSELTPGCTVTGRIKLDGESCLGMDPVLLRRRVGMVFQRPNPFPMSIRENVLYGVKAQSGSKEHFDQILETSLRKAVIWFMASVGQHGVNLFSSVTDLDFAVFASIYGPRPYYDTMLENQDVGALLLLVLTVTLTLLAMLLQRRFAKRYRGSITA